MDSARTIEARRDDLRTTRIVSQPLPRLQPGQALLAVDQFGLTANNVTYGATGDTIGYWGFFPASDGWGRIPAWGFAEVADSRVAGLDPGTRVFGYLPMGTHLVVQPDRIARGGFIDAAPHRAELPGVYNGYRRCAADPLYDPAAEPIMTIFFPLFVTSFVLDDFLADHGDFGAEQVVLSSASSKTSAGTALCIARRPGDRPRIVGLTSAGNRAFTESMGCYDDVHTYDELESLPDRPTVYVDVAGDMALRLRIHRHYGEALRYSCAVGLAHWDAPRPPEPLPGPKPEFFFAPAQIDKRLLDWGAAGYQQRLIDAWGAITGVAAEWFDFTRLDGLDAAPAALQALVEGTADPRQACIVAV